MHSGVGLVHLCVLNSIRVFWAKFGVREREEHFIWILKIIQLELLMLSELWTDPCSRTEKEGEHACHSSHSAARVALISIREEEILRLLQWDFYNTLMMTDDWRMLSCECRAMIPFPRLISEHQCRKRGLVLCVACFDRVANCEHASEHVEVKLTVSTLTRDQGEPVILKNGLLQHDNLMARTNNYN